MTPYANAHARLLRIDRTFQLVMNRNPRYTDDKDRAGFFGRRREAERNGELTLACFMADQDAFDRAVHSAVLPDESYAWWGDFLKARTAALHAMCRLGKDYTEMVQTLNLADESHVYRILHATRD